MPLRLPDLLATRKGRLTAFFMLYVTEGIPLGFTATAIATQMRRQGVGPEAIGAFVGSLYLPWAFKWLVGPFVDTFSSDRFGRRKLWIFMMQIGMMATLIFAMPVDFATQLGLFTAIILVHNAFGATQDVAIDAMAVNVLPEHERGVANGFMFAGASIGQAIGGSGVLFLSAVMPFSSTYIFVVVSILAVTLFVVLPLKEPKAPPRPNREKSALAAVADDLSGFVRDSWRAFTGSRAALVGVIVALLPAGAYALSLALQSNLAVELGLTDNDIAQLNLASTVIFALACVAGGWLSDRFGRRRMLALFVFLTVIPTLWLAWSMVQANWIMPIEVNMPNRPVPSTALVVTFWAATIIYNVFQGLYYGVRTALFMDVTTRAVAATQFTAYMAMCNLSITYTSWWQGLSIVRWGYPVTLALDCAFGLVMLFFLPLMAPKREAGDAAPVSEIGRHDQAPVRDATRSVAGE
jgi:MFS transporter, PAT family, beta-lactamase induction signal transducer AmpG